MNLSIVVDSNLEAHNTPQAIQVNIPEGYSSMGYFIVIFKAKLAVLSNYTTIAAQ